MSPTIVIFAFAAIQSALGWGMPAGPAPGGVAIYRDAPCPEGRGNDVLVCSRPLTVEGARALRRLGACLATRHRAESLALLSATRAEAVARDLVQRLARMRSGCLAPGRRLAVSGLLLQGAVAEALVGDRTRRLDPARPLQARDEADHMGLCLIAAAPEAVDMLLASLPGAPAETAALAALEPRLPSCLREGVALRLHPRVLRALLALSAYRLGSHQWG